MGRYEHTIFDDFYLYVPLLRENGTLVRRGNLKFAHHVVECTRPKSKHPLFQFSAETYLTIDAQLMFKTSLRENCLLCVETVYVSDSDWLKLEIDKSEIHYQVYLVAACIPETSKK